MPARFGYEVTPRMARRIDNPILHHVVEDEPPASSLDVTQFIFSSSLDLVEEAAWEEHVEFVSLEEAGLEENWSQPAGDTNVPDYVEWFYDAECPRYEV